MAADSSDDFQKIFEQVESYFLARQMQALETLAGGVAHEFNNLLTGIDGYARLAKERKGDAVITERALGFCLQATRRGTELVNRLRHFSGRRSQELETGDILPVIRDLVELHRAEIESDDILVETLYGQLPPVRFDPVIFGIAFVDMVQNARQAVRNVEGRARMITFTTRVEDGEAVLRIKDNGRGMSSDELAQALTPFYTRKGELGEDSLENLSGLGLSVARGIFKKLGGDLTIDSEAGEGTEVRISLPPISGLPAMAPKRVLVVDDEVTIRRIFSLFLTRAGFDVVTASDGEKGLVCLLEEEFDCVILDQMMPNMSGTDMLAAMREMDFSRPLPPVIMVTAAYSPNLARRSIELGAVACTAKPINRQKIIYLINTHTGLQAPLDSPSPLETQDDSVAKRVLAIDADPLNREVLDLILRRFGYVPRTVGLSKEAEAATQFEYYNLILIDVYMNDESGIKLVRNLRLNNPYTPILVTSPRMSQRTLQAALAAGATQAMQKPLDIQNLMVEVQRMDLLFREKMANT